MFARLCLALLFVLAINFQVCSQAVARESGWDKHAVKAWHYYNLGVYDRCEKELLTALQSIGDSVDTRLATTLNNLAAVYAEKGQYAHAEKLYARAIEVYGVHLDALDPFVVVAQNNLAVLYYNQRRYREAEVLYSQVIGSGETAFGFDSAAFALSLNNLAAIQAGQKRYSGALSLLRRALSIHEKNGTTRSAAYASVLNNLGAAEFLSGNYVEAEFAYSQAFDLRKQLIAPFHPDLAQSHYNLAKLYLRTGRFEDARARLQDALTIRTSCFGKSHKSVQDCLALARELPESSTMIVKK